MFLKINPLSTRVPNYASIFSHPKTFDIKKIALQAHGVVCKEYDKYGTFVNENHV
jgi:hypothetical protein